MRFFGGLGFFLVEVGVIVLWFLVVFGGFLGFLFFFGEVFG